MPRFVMPSVSDSQLVSFLKEINRLDNVPFDFSFSDDQRNILLGFFGKYFDYNHIYSIKGPITSEEKDEICKRFEYEPDIMYIPYSELETFISQMNSLTSLPSGTGYTKGIRIYIGFDIDAALSKERYGVVITPIYSPISNIGILDRENEKEMKWFSDSSKSFFALAATKGIGKFTNDYEYCKKLIDKEDRSGKQVAYFMFSDLNTFIQKLSGGVTPKTLQLEFGRTRNGDATIVLSFLDSSGNIIKSSVPSGGVAESLYFDQGDLMPPPPKDGVLRDTFFPR